MTAEKLELIGSRDVGLAPVLDLRTHIAILNGTSIYPWTRCGIRISDAIYYTVDPTDARCKECQKASWE